MEVWIARQDGRDVGRIRLITQSNVALLEGLEVESLGARGQVACQLIQAAAEYARDRGCLKLVVGIDQRLERMSTLLRCIGFQSAGDGAARRYYLDLYRRLRPKNCAALIVPSAIGIAIEHQPPAMTANATDPTEHHENIA